MKAILDTSVFADLTLKIDDKQKAASAALTRYTEILILDYLLKEFKRGPLTGFVWLYKKFAETQSEIVTIDWLHRISRTPQRYRTSTALEAYKVSKQLALDIGLKQILSAADPNDTEDKAMADFLGTEIKRAAIKAWNGRQNHGTVKSLLPCYHVTDIGVVNGALDLQPIECSRGAECCVHKAMTADKQKLKQIRQGVDNCDEKNETSRRRSVIKKMISHPNDTLTRDECRRVGDAYFVFAAKADECILTTNTADIGPIGAACGVPVERP